MGLFDSTLPHNGIEYKNGRGGACLPFPLPSVDEAAGLAPGNEENEAGGRFRPEKPCLPLSTEGTYQRKRQNSLREVRLYLFGKWEVMSPRISCNWHTIPLQSSLATSAQFHFQKKVLVHIHKRCHYEYYL